MAANKIDRNKLYVYDLDENVLQSLKLAFFDEYLNEVEAPTATEQTVITLTRNEIEKLKIKQVSTSLSCSTCDIKIFSNIEAKKEHFRSDFHIFNIRQQLKGLPRVSFIEFEKRESDDKNSKCIEADKERNDLSDIDSEEESDTNSSSNDDSFNKSKSPTQNYATYENNMTDNSYSLGYLNTRSPKIYLKSDLLPKSEVFGIYKSLFSKTSIEKPIEEICKWNIDVDASLEISAIFMVGGGHFAGAIVSHQRNNIKGNIKSNDLSIQEQAVRFIEQKTFHRYTTRRKQGGSQSAMDNAKGKANSAGSTLRRYNEAALRTDITELLKEWEPYLIKSQNIFVRANSVHDKKIFTDSGLIKPESLNSFSFTTGRPTINELKKAWSNLTYLTIDQKPTPIENKDNSELLKKSTQQNLTKKQSKVELTREETQTNELISLVKRARAPLLISYLHKNKLDVNFKLQPESQYTSTPTLLHYASQNNIKQMVIILLTNLKADPCIKNSFGKTPFDLAKIDTTRYAFQIARFNLGEDFCDWEISHIDEPLSRGQVEEIKQREEEKKNQEIELSIKKELQAVKEREKEDLEKKRGKGRTLEPIILGEQQNLNSLTDDMKKRLMREQRARAAEARLQKLSGKN